MRNNLLRFHTRGKVNTAHENVLNFHGINLRKTYLSKLVLKKVVLFRTRILMLMHIFSGASFTRIFQYVFRFSELFVKWAIFRMLRGNKFFSSYLAYFLSMFSPIWPIFSHILQLFSSFFFPFFWIRKLKTKNFYLSRNTGTVLRVFDVFYFN